MTFSIVPPHLAVKAMRDNGYKNTAYALAELIDNSIQAGATRVELLCSQQTVQLSQRQRDRIHQIAVLDNAEGMSKETLQIALQFGNGTRLDPREHKGIGRFGMGLPASSISQCMRVEVWTWQNGLDNTLYTYLDLSEIANQQMTEVPTPVQSEIPELWRQMSTNWEDSGTLVVWSDLDRLMWRTAKALFSNSEFVVGRMYRRFLRTGQVKIRFASFIDSDPQRTGVEQYVRPNDPNYLMTGTSTPTPYDKDPMFSEWTEDVVYKIMYREEIHEVYVRYSIVKEGARKGHNPGSRDYGRHAARNTGVSIVRAERELELDDTWSDPSEPRDRWWGIEVEFPPALDEIFGVTNNKQHAHNFSEFATFNIDEILQVRNLSSIIELKEQLEEEEDPRAPLIDLAHQIKKNRNLLQRLLRVQTASENSSSKKRHDDKNSPESKATEVTQHRKDEGHIGVSDSGEEEPIDDRKLQIQQELTNQGVTQSAAEELAARTVSDGLKYTFAPAELESPAFFSVKQMGGSIIITLNTLHPAYDSLVEALDCDDEDQDNDLRQRLQSAEDGLKLLLMAWARFEDEQPDGIRRERAQEARVDWGRIARQFLRDE